LMVLAATTVMLALSWGGHKYGWGSAEILGLVSASLALWILFSVWLARAPEPFIPLPVMKDPIVRIVIVAGFFSIGTLTALSIFVPLYLQLVLGLSPSRSGIALIAFMAGTTVGSLICGGLMAWTERYKRGPIVGLTFSIPTLLILALWPTDVSLVQLTALLALCGIGTGMMYPLTTVAIQNSVLPHQMGTATGMLNFFRLLGGAVIVAGFGALVLGSVETRGIATLNVLTNSMPGETTDFTSAFQEMFAMAATFLAIALVSVLVLPERPLRGPDTRLTSNS